MLNEAQKRIRDNVPFENVVVCETKQEWYVVTLFNINNKEILRVINVLAASCEVTREMIDSAVDWDEAILNVQWMGVASEYFEAYRIGPEYEEEDKEKKEELEKLSGLLSEGLDW